MLGRGAISPSQFGFRPGSSTQEAMLSVTQTWHQNMEAGGSTWRLEAAQSVSSCTWPRLLTRCPTTGSGVGTPLLAWFRDSLSGRSQFVALQGSSSHSISGVPQGSILGPLLFILTFDGIFRLPLSVRSASDGLHRRCNILQNILH